MDDVRLAEQRRLIEAMRSTSDEPRAEFARELVTVTPQMAEQLAEAYVPETHALILTKDKMREVLASFAQDLSRAQADWLVRWTKIKNE